MTLLISSEAHHARGDYAEAITRYQAVLRSPGLHQNVKAKTLFNLSICFEALGDHIKSKEALESLSSIPPQLDPVPSPERPLIFHSAPLDLVRLAAECERAGDLPKAIKYLEIVSVSRAFRSDTSLLVWLSKLDITRSDSLRTTAQSILPSTAL